MSKMELLSALQVDFLRMEAVSSFLFQTVAMSLTMFLSSVLNVWMDFTFTKDSATLYNTAVPLASFPVAHPV